MPDPRLPGPDFPIQVGALAELSDGFTLTDEPSQLAIAAGSEPERLPDEPDFYANLADNLDAAARAAIANDLVAKVERDIDSRSDYDKIMAKGLKELGFDRDDDRNSEPFPGASAVFHPLLAQACVEFQARAIKELFPPNGPVKTRIVGAQTRMKRQKADRAAEMMNWQFTERLPVSYAMPEYRSDLDAMLMMLPIYGCMFKKVYWDTLYSKPCSPFILPEDFIVPYSATSLEDAPRLTHRLRMHGGDVKRNQKAGLWRAVELGAPADDPNPSEARQKAEKIEGKEKPGDVGEDDRYIIYECHVDLEDPKLDDSDVPLPYVVTVSYEHREVLAIRRNWRQDDVLRRRRVWFVKYGCIPWRGFYDIGLLHLIGGLAKAATGTLRLLMDSGSINTIPGGVRLKGARVSSSSVAFRPMEFSEIDAPGVDDVRKIAMPFPTKEPSPTLFQLLGFLVQAGQQFATVATQPAADMNSQAPVGTTLALIEEGSRVYSAIHARLHFAQGSEFSKIAELNYEHLDDQVIVNTFNGELIASYQDFDSEVDIQPVSDPNIFSHVQRAAQANAALQLVGTAKQMGVPVDARAAVLLAAETNKLPDIETLFPEPEQAVPLDPVSEVQAVVQGKPVKAFPGQDHKAHIAALQGVMQDPLYMPMMQMAGPKLMALISDHMVAQMKEEAIAGVMQQAQMIGQMPPPQVVDGLIAQALIKSAQERAQMQAAQAQQAAQQGGDGLARAAMADVQRKAQDDVAKAQLEGQRIQLQAQKDQTEAQIRAAEVQAKVQNELRLAQIQLAETQAKAQDDVRKAEIRVAELQLQARREDAERQGDITVQMARVAATEQATDTRAAVDRDRMATDAAVQGAKIASTEKMKTAELEVAVARDREENADDRLAAEEGFDPKVST